MNLPSLPRRYHNASIWLLYAAGFVPAAWYFYLGATGQLVGNPVKIFEHFLGEWALQVSHSDAGDLAAQGHCRDQLG
jgi:sulfoxide reductase heme-binding subunit YedZ